MVLFSPQSKKYAESNAAKQLKLYARRIDNCLQDGSLCRLVSLKGAESTHGAKMSPNLSLKISILCKNIKRKHTAKKF